LHVTEVAKETSDSLQIVDNAIDSKIWQALKRLYHFTVMRRAVAVVRLVSSGSFSLLAESVRR
jgi:hypothetical protein